MAGLWAMILGLRAAGLVQRLQLQRRGEIARFGGAQILLCIAQRHLRHRRDPSRQHHRRFQQIGVLGDPVDQADGLRLIRADDLAGREQFPRFVNCRDRDQRGGGRCTLVSITGSDGPDQAAARGQSERSWVRRTIVVLQ